MNMNILHILLAAKKADLKSTQAVIMIKELGRLNSDYIDNELIIELYNLHKEACGAGDGVSADYIHGLINSLLHTQQQKYLSE